MEGVIGKASLLTMYVCLRTSNIDIVIIISVE